MRPPTVCRQPVSGSISLPLSGCFSPFPHGTCSLSVMHEYLGLESGLPMFRQDFTCPALLKDNVCSTRTGLSPTTAALSRAFHFIPHCHWPGPRSLATTCGVSVDVLSCRYLDVSVPCVRFLHPILFRCRYLINNAWKPVQFCPHGQRPADGAVQKHRRASALYGNPQTGHPANKTDFPSI